MAAKRKEATAKASNVHFLHGTDEAQVKEAAIRLARRLSPPEGGDFGTEIVDGTAESAEHATRLCAQAVEGLQTMPMFGGGKVVWLRNVNFLSDTVTGRAQSTLEALEELLGLLEGGMPADVHFILSALAPDRRRGFFQKLDKLAQSEAFDLPDTSQRGWEGQVEATISDRASALGLSFEPEAMELFMALAGERTQQIMGELEKLDLYLGPDRRRVSVQDVRIMVPLSRAGVIFELGNALGRRDARRALSLLDSLLAQGENAIGLLLAAIIPKMRNLVLARDLVERQRAPMQSYAQFQGALENLPPEETAHLPRKKDGGLNVYPLFLAAQESRQFSEAELRHGLRSCLRANQRLVGSSLDPRVVLSQLLVEILAAAPRPSLVVGRE
jgi:DNA polymerase-3 subunit delta